MTSCLFSILFYVFFLTQGVEEVVIEKEGESDVLRKERKKKSIHCFIQG